MQVRSTYRFARISAFKAREVTREIQGLPASDALDLLRFVPKKAAGLVRKTLTSAIANAENNNNLNVSNLVVQEAVVGEGPTSKRFQPKARGSAGPIRKRTSHIRIILTDEIEIKRREKKRREKDRRNPPLRRLQRASLPRKARKTSRPPRPRPPNPQQQRRRRNPRSKVMGQKVNPIGFRLAVNRDWRSKWYASRRICRLFACDGKIRKFVKKKLRQAAVSRSSSSAPGTAFA